jgi:hypothetical protein
VKTGKSESISGFLEQATGIKKILGFFPFCPATDMVCPPIQVKTYDLSGHQPSGSGEFAQIREIRVSLGNSVEDLNPQTETACRSG